MINEIAFVRQRITQHIRYGLTPLPFGTLPSATSYMLKMLGEISSAQFKRENSTPFQFGKK